MENELFSGDGWICHPNFSLRGISIGMFRWLVLHILGGTTVGVNGKRNIKEIPAGADGRTSIPPCEQPFVSLSRNTPRQEPFFLAISGTRGPVCNEVEVHCTQE